MLELKFNHESSSIIDALGITQEEVNTAKNKLNEVVKNGKYGGHKVSGIVEDIINCEEITKTDLVVLLVFKINENRSQERTNLEELLKATQAQKKDEPLPSIVGEA